MPLLTTFAGDALNAYGFSRAKGSAASYEQIATVIADGTSASITFSSIPSSYKHLQIRMTHRAAYSFNGNLLHRLRFNGDTGSNYDWHVLEGQGSAGSIYSQAGNNATDIRIGLTPASGTAANAFAASIFDVFDYTNTNKFKTSKTIQGSMTSAANAGLYSGLWRNTSAITSITLLNDVGFGNYVSGSRFTLYGIKG